MKNNFKKTTPKIFPCGCESLKGAFILPSPPRQFLRVGTAARDWWDSLRSGMSTAVACRPGEVRIRELCILFTIAREVFA
jgi:hypothetical protein